MQYDEKIQIANNVMKNMDPDVFKWLHQVFYLESQNFHEKACDILTEQLLGNHTLAIKLSELIPYGVFGDKTIVIVSTYCTPNPFITRLLHLSAPERKDP